MIGLFLGDNKLPLEIISSLKKKKINFLIIDLTQKNQFKKFNNSFFINIAKFGKILKILKKNKCNKVIFAGRINKPKISSLKFDIRGLYYMPRIIKAAKLGDAAILKELIKILSENSIKVIKMNKFNPELTLKKGNYSKIEPNSFEIKEIKKGINFLNKTNSHNHVQAAVIRNNKLIAFEKKEGTKSMLLKIKKSSINNGFLIKLPKKKQDLRVDLPTIGYETIEDCKKIGLKGIILKSNNHIILDKNKIIKFTNKHKMILHII